MFDILIIGGGLAGLTSSILLNRSGLKVKLVEKKTYPFHKVCGEYISNEVRPFLLRENLLPKSVELAEMKSFLLSSISGKSAQIPLKMGGFGISRYQLDHHLYQIAKQEGVDIETGKSITSVKFNPTSNDFYLTTQKQEDYTAKVVVGAYGKRSKLDKSLDRNFINKRSPYLGVKYHIKYDHQEDQVALHNFSGGYCGLNRVENDISNLCYLTHRSKLKNAGSIDNLEKNVLSKNPHLAHIFNTAEFLFDKPEVINEISFETKAPVEQHILMSGDSAGMITPLCGNGMAIAIHSANILSTCIIDSFNQQVFDRNRLERLYATNWKNQFATRLSVGRNLQKLFGNGLFSGFTVNLIKWNKPLAKFLIEQTHGKSF